MATTDSIISDNLSFVDEQKNGMASFINAIADAASIQFNNSIDSLSNAGHVSIGSQVDAITAIAGSFPLPPSILIPNFTVPALPDLSIDDVEHDLSVLEAARTKLLADLEDGGYGIDVNDEIQMLDRTRDRAVKQAETTKDQIDQDFQSRGFGIPPGTMFGPLERANQESRGVLSETNREIYLQRAQQLFQYRQFAIGTAATLDSARANILEVKFRIQEARARFTLAAFASQLDKFKTQLSAAIDRAQLSVRLYESQSSIVSARVQAAGESARVTIASYQANVQSFLGVMEYNLNKARASVDAAQAQADVRLKAATAGTDFYASIVSGALAAVNTVVSQSTETEG
jgi:hypothetical protein